MKNCTCKGLVSYLFKQTDLCKSCVKKKEEIDNQHKVESGEYWPTPDLPY